MGTLFIILLLSILALPGAVWFARDASVARLNSWMWALGGMLSIVAPSLLFIAVMRVLHYWALLPEGKWPLGNVLGASTIAVGWAIAALIHKRVLKPRREAIIGTSLNYIGGWLGTLICVLLGSAIAPVGFYGVTVRNRVDYYCGDEHSWRSLLSCGGSFAPEIFGTVLTIVSVILCVAGSISASGALAQKRSYAVRITGGLFIWFVVLNLVDSLADLTAFITNGEQDSIWMSLKKQIRPAASPNVFTAIGWLVYLTKSRRIREVYGCNFGERNRKNVCLDP